MIIRAIESDLATTNAGDWRFGHGYQDYLVETEAIKLNITTRLRCYLNDCFFDVEMGVDWWNLLGSKDVNKIAMSIRRVIVESEGVTALTDMQIVRDLEERTLTITYKIDTLYSESVEGSITI